MKTTIVAACALAGITHLVLACVADMWPLYLVIAVAFLAMAAAAAWVES